MIKCIALALTLSVTPVVAGSCDGRAIMSNRLAISSMITPSVETRRDKPYRTMTRNDLDEFPIYPISKLIKIQDVSRFGKEVVLVYGQDIKKTRILFRLKRDAILFHVLIVKEFRYRKCFEHKENSNEQ